MKISFQLLLFTSLLSLFCLAARAGEITVTRPAVPPPDGNTATAPKPRMDWEDHYLANLDDAAKLPKIDLVFDGDSITDLWRYNGGAIWRQKYVPLNAVDFGISGDRTENLLWRLENGQITPNVQPKLIFLLIGTNNLATNTPDQVIEGVQAVLQKYRTLLPNATVVLQAIFPRGHSPQDPDRALIKQINAKLATLAGDHVLYLDFGDKFLEPDGSIARDMMGDFLHPTPKGYQIWADAIQPTIDQFYPPAK